MNKTHPGRITAEMQQHRIAVRTFLAESCEIAKSLPAPKKMLFLMRFDCGFSVKEIAELCKCDETTVYRRIKKIAEEINARRNCIRDQGREDNEAVK